MSDYSLEQPHALPHVPTETVYFCPAQSELAPVSLLGITDTDRMDWLERQHPNTLIAEPGIVTSSLRLMVDEMIKRERAAVMPNDQAHARPNNP